ncbi:energy transducer TonB (plasmid) [Pedobacter sp. BS3]|uniref:energy transducer TonB n=1 Tax=Pedobacter sp. BS3 TaxID=2567937 RepID=UPI0011EE6AF0|nr:energy transducer TonB [Pedobacter sp. BS3]TZF85718.1 energy transducer TonB [Pedobacter sp. BS3]
MEENDTIRQQSDENQPVKKDKSLLYMGIALAVIIVSMGYLTLFVDDPWKLFKPETHPVKVVDNGSKSLDKTEEMSDEDVRKSLIKFIEAFYVDMRRGYFDPPSYFAPITETFYNYHNLTHRRLRDIYWRRKADMESLKSNWIVSSLDFERRGQQLIATYWLHESYYRPSRKQQEEGDFKMEMTIDENGKIVSYLPVEERNIRISPLYITLDSIIDTPVAQPSATNVQVEQKPQTTESADQKVYNLSAVESPPEFKGGAKKMQRIIRRKLHYPDRAKSLNVQGQVMLSFIVEKNGSLSDLKVVKGIGSGCDEEALRVVQKEVSEWKPGTIAGKPVRTLVTLPIVFQL